MPDLSLDLRHLRDAIIVAQHGSMRRAAELAGLSESTLSRRVQSLERRLGIALFERTRTGSRLTPAGEHFLRDAEFGADHLRRVVEGISLVRRGLAGSLRIGVIGSLAQGPLSDLLATYHQRFPDVDVRIEEGSSQSQAVAVLNGKLDAAFLAGEPRLPGCESRHFYDDVLLAAIPANHSLSSRSGLTWDDLREETLLVTADGSGPEVEGILLRRLSGLGFRPEIAVQHIGRDNLLNIVGKGFGLTLAVSAACGVPYPGVQFVPIEPAEIVSWSVVWPKNNANPALKRLLELSVATMSSSLPIVA